MSDHDRLHELLEQTAPDRPELDAGSRVAAVARRGRIARRRDRGLAFGAAAAVLALAVGVGAQRQGQPLVVRAEDVGLPRGHGRDRRAARGRRRGRRDTRRRGLVGRVRCGT